MCFTDSEIELLGRIDERLKAVTERLVDRDKIINTLIKQNTEMLVICQEFKVHCEAEKQTSVDITDLETDVDSLIASFNKLKGAGALVLLILAFVGLVSYLTDHLRIQ